MTVSTEIDHNEYTGNGTTTVFPYQFRIFKSSDLVVQTLDTNENIKTLTLDTDYSVQGAGGYNGGSITLPAPLADGWKITITRELPVTQETDLRNQGSFFPEVHEDAFDKLTMLIQRCFSVFGLALRKPNYLAQFYDALNNRIRNLRDPAKPQDAATKSYVDSLANTNLSRTLRVPESIPTLPDAAARANKIAAFDSQGNPIVVLPPSGSASDVLIELAKPAGAAGIGVQPQGNLAQLINFVTPEQFGAIGDGTVHPLSERYATLEEAQAVYPHVTSLSQTIDWATCQAAENYARGRTTVYCPAFAKYHFGFSDYLAIGVDSKWKGGDSPNWHSESNNGTTMIRDGSLGSFGQDAIVRVMNAVDAGSPDDAVRGVVFKGFYLTRNRASRRYPTKGTNTIGIHLNGAIKADIDVAIDGCEYALFGYACWGLTGRVRIDSCHKGVFFKPSQATPERAAGSNNTSIDLRVEIDHTIFPITLSECNYSRFTGWFEGALEDFDNYDTANETAIGLDIEGCVNCTFELGIESFQGIHTYARNRNSCTIHYFPYGSTHDGYLTTTGVQTSDYSIKMQMGEEPTELPLNSRAYNVNGGGNNQITFLDTYWYLDTVASSSSDTHYLFHGDILSSWVIVGGGVNPLPANSSYATVLPVREDKLLMMIKILGVRNGTTYFAPNGYEYVSENLWRATNYKTSPFTIGAPSQVEITPPAGFKFREVDVFSNLALSSANNPVTIALLSGNTRTYVCNSQNSALALRWKDYISV